MIVQFLFVLAILAAAGVVYGLVLARSSRGKGVIADTVEAWRAEDRQLDEFDVTMRDTSVGDVFSAFPEDTSPLTRYHRSRPGLTEKWDLYVRGFETGTAYSELADPVVQRERFEAQALAAANGDPEAMVMDEDFLVAMEQGFPPCGGMGMGIDRLLMVLTGQGIRETITFPLVKRG